MGANGSRGEGVRPGPDPPAPTDPFAESGKGLEIGVEGSKKGGFTCDLEVASIYRGLLSLEIRSSDDLPSTAAASKARPYR